MAGFQTSKYFEMYTAHEPYNLIDCFTTLQRLNRKHCLLCEQSCNGTVDDKTYEEMIKAIEGLFNSTVENIQKHLLKNNRVFSLKARYQYDPRGLTCKLILIEKPKTHGFVPPFENDISSMYLMEWW
jgi:hypothetical protein